MKTTPVPSSLAMAVLAFATFVTITHSVPVDVPVTNYDPCAITECPALASNHETSGSGEEPENNNSMRKAPSRYELTTNKIWTTQGQVIEVKLQFKECIPFNEDSTNGGPTWYRLDAVSQDTDETIGEFFPPAFNSESRLCPNNAVSFLTTVPTVLDVPRRYRWKPKSLETVCFRATIFHRNDSMCETITRCISDIPPIPTSPPVIIITTPPPSQKKVERCEAKWQCDLPTYKDREYCGCDEVTKICKTYAKKCEIRKEECIYQKTITKKAGACPPEPPSPTPPTIPPPTQPPVLGNCIKLNSSKQCTSTGDYKSTQCDRQPDGSHKCYCMSYHGVKYIDTEVIINGCHSPNSYDDLRCIR